MKNEPFRGIGRRKNSTARVYLSSGSGSFVVNNKLDLNSYLKRESLVIHAIKPLEILNLKDKYDLKIFSIFFENMHPIVLGHVLQILGFYLD